MDKLCVRAYGKINLGLDVIGTLPNGYHQVKMIMQTVSLYDRLEIRKILSPVIKIKTNLHFLPTKENNLVYTAAQIFREKFNISEGIFINLEKHIPVAAGMAGGSSDAAATLKALNKLFQTGLTAAELCEMGLPIGADVPYCILGGTVLAEGIGEILTPLHKAPDVSCVIVKPLINISTKLVYNGLKLDESVVHPDIDALRSSIEADDIYGMCSHMGNVLESVSISMHPVIADIKSEMMSFGALGTLMSGSGPTVFGLFNDTEAANRAFYNFKVGPFGRNTYLSGFYNPVI